MGFDMVGDPNKLVTEVYATKVLARKRHTKAEKSNEPGFLMLIGLAVGLALSFTIKYLMGLIGGS
ncbi:hypothetical protein OAJ77_05835 [Rhodospirillales bacterium]|nr:hypothetical protein [Rhodospirillales bacterium]